MEPASKRQKVTPPPDTTTEICTSCNIPKPLGQFSRCAKFADGLQYSCKSCDAERSKRQHNTKQGFLRQLVLNAHRSSERRNARGREHGIPTITPDTIKSLAKNGRCALSGVSIVFKQYAKWQASLDRVDDTKGYHPNNVRLVALEFNTPTKWTLAEFNAMFCVVYEDVYKLLVDPVSFEQTIKPYQRRPKVFDGQERLQCWDCQVFKPLDAYYKQLQHGCKECKASRTKAHTNTPCGRLHRLVSSARYRHNSRLKRNIDRADAGPCDITFDQLVGLYRQQGGRCFYSGMPLGFSSDGDWMVSLERLDVTKSYTVANVALICVQLNAMDRGIQSGNTDQGWSKAKVEHIRELCRK